LTTSLIIGSTRKHKSGKTDSLLVGLEEAEITTVSHSRSSATRYRAATQYAQRWSFNGAYRWCSHTVNASEAAPAMAIPLAVRHADHLARRVQYGLSC